MSEDRFVNNKIMLGNRDTRERCSDNLSIARQKVETGRLKVRTIKNFRGMQTPLLVIDRRTCLVHVCVIPNRRVTHLRVGDVLIRLDIREKETGDSGSVPGLVRC